MLYNILIICIPLIILGVFMCAAFYIGYKAGRGEAIIQRDNLEIVSLGEDKDKIADFDPFEGDDDE